MAYASLGHVPAQQQGDGHSMPSVVDIPTCAFCKETFADANGLRSHKKAMAQNEAAGSKPGKNLLKHFYCHECDKDFISGSAGQHHWIQNHAEKQNINCPGCDTHFAQFSGFIKHIECDECPKITQDNAAARCKKSLEFAKALSKLDAMRPELDTVTGPKDFGSFLGGDPESIKPISKAPALISPWHTKDNEGWGPSEADLPQENDFPALARPSNKSASTKAPGSRNVKKKNNGAEEQQEPKAWGSATASAKTLFPKAFPAQTPTHEQLDRLQVEQTRAMERARADHTDPDHPNSPYFNAERYFNVYTKKYKCPRDNCKKTFTNKSALVQHLMSPTHTFGKVYTCPNCLNKFGALFALAAHCESASRKCHIRNSDMYERFLSQLTWNLVEVTGEHETDGTLKYDISTAAKVDYGIEKDERPTFGHQQVYGDGSVARTAAPSDTPTQPRLTMEALAQHQHQQKRQFAQSASRQQSMQNPTVVDQQSKVSGGASIALTADALRQLNLNNRDSRKTTGQTQQASIATKQGNEEAWSHAQSGWEKGAGADVGDEDQIETGW